MPFAQLVIQQITCRTPTETGINDHDEVYFLVAGATSSGKTVRVSPKGPAQDYFSMAAGDSLHEIVLWQDDLEDGKDAFLIVFVREQGKPQAIGMRSRRIRHRPMHRQRRRAAGTRKLAKGPSSQSL